MKTDIKQLLKELSTRDLEFKDPTDAKLLNKEKEYHFHDTYLSINNKNCDYSSPCLVELEIGNSLIFNLKRKNEIQQNVVRVDKNEYLGIKPSLSVTPVIPVYDGVTPTVTPVETKVDTTVVSDAAAKALIEEFIEKNQ